MFLLVVLSVLLTGDFPGYAVAGVEEDHPAIVWAIDNHDNN